MCRLSLRNKLVEKSENRVLLQKQVALKNETFSQRREKKVGNTNSLIILNSVNQTVV